jgi:protocatechuate 3,4-dioxygenase beta subunit
MKVIYQFAFVLSINVFLACKGQQTSPISAKVEPENPEAHLHKMPAKVPASDTSPGWNRQNKNILITGTVYKADDKSPVPGVLIYYYHTNTEGKYIHNPVEKRSMPPNSNGQTHGFLRGWVKTDKDGRYYIYTSRPGAYPNDNVPAHIHFTIHDPFFNSPYYIDDIVFDDDIKLKSAIRQKMENRGGSGIVRLINDEGQKTGERNIYLGLNIPGYPDVISKNNSGRNIGEDVMSFTPYHAWGPDKGSSTCPVCKYGWYHGILFFVGNNPDWPEIKQWLLFLDSLSIKREKYLKAYFIYGNEESYSKLNRETELESLGKELQLKKIALTFVPSFSDRETDVYLNRVNPETKNTIIIYKRSNIVEKYINLKPGNENFNRIIHRLDETINRYFNME